MLLHFRFKYLTHSLWFFMSFNQTSLYNSHLILHYRLISCFAYQHSSHNLLLRTLNAGLLKKYIPLQTRLQLLSPLHYKKCHQFLDETGFDRYSSSMENLPRWKLVIQFLKVAYDLDRQEYKTCLYKSFCSFKSVFIL